MGGNLATDYGRNIMKFLTPFSTALGMRDRNGHEKKPQAQIYGGNTPGLPLQMYSIP